MLSNYKINKGATKEERERLENEILKRAKFKNNREKQTRKKIKKSEERKD
jgi:hypothetical protein